MKTNRTLRILTLLAFLLLIAPFYDSCDMRLVEANAEATVDSTAVETDSVRIDTTGISKVEVNDTIINAKSTFGDSAYNFIVDEDSSHGYDFAYAILNHTTKEIIREIKDVASKKDWYENLLIYFCFVFDIIVIISFSLFVLSFFNKQTLFKKLALINCILIIITFCYIIFLEGSFNHWHQIKWGYYAFIFVNLLIFYYSKPSEIQTKS